MAVPLTIKLYDALRRMRVMSEVNIPFSISFISYSDQQQHSEGLKMVPAALLRTGYRANQSELHDILIAYTELESETPKQFYLPLLMTFNGLHIIP